MYYLILDGNNKHKIIDDNIFKVEKVWSCSQLIRKAKVIDNKLYYETAESSLILAGLLLKTSQKKTDLVAEGLYLKYDNKFYKIRTLEGKKGLFIVLPKSIDDGIFIQVYVKIEKLVQDKIQDISEKGYNH